PAGAELLARVLHGRRRRQVIQDGHAGRRARTGRPDGIPRRTLRQPPPQVHWGSEALGMSGLELMRAARDRRLPEPPISTLTGLRPTDVGLGKTTFAMPASPWWQSGAGVFLAGTLAFVADAPLGCAILTSAPPGTAVSTSELS